ncbi:MAG: peptidoglycan-binding domain-containing protein, partial [Actinomycetota bacterium]
MALIAVMAPAQSASAATAPPKGASTTGDTKTSAKPAPGQPGFGDKGPAVESIQRALIANGFTLRGGATGVFDTNTRRTLRNFQRVVGLRVTGVVDMRTAQVLKLAAPTSTTSIPTPVATFPFTRETLPRRGASGAGVLTVQKTLAAVGLTVRGGIDGSFGRGTTTTITEYQKIKGLPETGLLDEATAVSLSLIAPVAAATAPATTAAPATTVAPATTAAPATPAAPAVSAAATPALTL